MNYTPNGRSRLAHTYTVFSLLKIRVADNMTGQRVFLSTRVTVYKHETTTCKLKALTQRALSVIWVTRHGILTVLCTRERCGRGWIAPSHGVSRLFLERTKYYREKSLKLFGNAENKYVYFILVPWIYYLWCATDIARRCIIFRTLGHLARSQAYQLGIDTF